MTRNQALIRGSLQTQTKTKTWCGKGYKVSSQSQQQSLKQLFTNTITDGKRLLTAQVNLTTTELSTSSKVIGQISLLAVIAISLLSIGSLFILITVAYALVALGLPVWAGFLIVAALLFLAAGTLGLVIKAKSKDVKAPALASAEWKKTSETLSALGK